MSGWLKLDYDELAKKIPAIYDRGTVFGFGLTGGVETRCEFRQLAQLEIVASIFYSKPILFHQTLPGIN
jgi:hypothetical protein